jgi:hypothetical protein
MNNKPKSREYGSSIYWFDYDEHAFGRTTNNNTTQVHATTEKNATKGENKYT